MAEPPPIAAIRGGTSLTEDELRGHLASLLELDCVGVLLGAGASVGAGGKTLASLAKAWKSKGATPDDPLVKLGFDLSNPEETWKQLLLAEEAERLGFYKLSEADAALLKTLRSDLRRELIRSAILSESIRPATLSDSAARREGHAKDSDPVEQGSLDAHRSLLRKLMLSRQPGQPAPWIFTTNYDLALEWAAELEGVALINGFNGLHRRRFEPRAFDLGWYSTGARGEARFGNTYAYLAKLHGSLSWAESSDAGEIEERGWSELSKEIEHFLGGEPEAKAPNCLLIPPGVGKYIETVGFAQGELFRRLAEFVTRQNSVIFVNGYSMSDPHLDRLLVGGLLNPTFHLVVCCFDGELGNKTSSTVLALKEGASTRLEALVARQPPSVTFIPGRLAAFERFVAMLPDPALIDEQARRTRKLVKELLARLGKPESEGSP